MPFVANYATLLLVFTCLSWRYCVGDGRDTDLDHGGNGSPVVAVWALPYNSSIPECGGDCEFVKAAYVKWLESVGVRGVPIRFDATPVEVKTIMDAVNGLFLPGGIPPVPDGARWAIEYASTLNDKGDFFPVWGTCLGWEWIAQTFAGDSRVLTVDYDAENLTQPLGLLPGVEDSRVLSDFPPELLEKASTEPLTANQHRKGVAPTDFAKWGLDQTFRMLAVNSDRKGSEYVSMVEAIDYPIYAVQWHPEKSAYDWGLDPDGTPTLVINHTADAIELSQALATFFASETGLSGHSLPNVTEWEPKMFHNREVTPTKTVYGQIYFLHSKTHGKKRPRVSQHKPLGGEGSQPFRFG